MALIGEIVNIIILTGQKQSMLVRCLPRLNGLLNITLVMFGLSHILDRFAPFFSVVPVSSLFPFTFVFL